MSVWAIIPVKPLGCAKSRLSPVLTPEQRFAFAEALLRNTLIKVLDVPEVKLYAACTPMAVLKYPES